MPAAMVNDSDGKLSLTISFPLTCEDSLVKNACQTIVSELDRYNLERTGDLPKRDILYTTPDGKTLLLGTICHQSASIDNQINPGILEQIIQSDSHFFSSFENMVFQQGARRFFSWCYKNTELNKIFVREGSHICGEFPDLHKNLIVRRFYKDLKITSQNKDKPNNLRISAEETYESYEELNPCHSEESGNQNAFGIFCHDTDKQELKAGLFGNFYPEKKERIAHGDILCFWVDATLRHKGLGTTLMHEAEKLLKQLGAQFIQLATNGFQAPEIYKKMGFDLVESCPNYYLLRDSSYSTYDGTKENLKKRDVQLYLRAEAMLPRDDTAVDI